MYITGLSQALNLYLPPYPFSRKDFSLGPAAWAKYFAPGGRCLCNRVPVRKTFRFCQASFEMSFPRAGMIRKERNSTDNLTSPQMLGTPGCAASNGLPSAHSILQCACSRTGPVTVNWLRLSCSHGICAAQHRPEGQVVCAARHSPVLCHLRLTATWTTNSLMYNALPSRITTAENAHPSFPSSFYLPSHPLTPHSFLCPILTSFWPHSLSFCALWQNHWRGLEITLSVPIFKCLHLYI